MARVVKLGVCRLNCRVSNRRGCSLHTGGPNLTLILLALLNPLSSAMLMISDVFKNTRFSWNSLSARWEKLNKVGRTLEEKWRFSG